LETNLSATPITGSFEYIAPAGPVTARYF
jgi:hypothetical protein